MVCFVHFFVSAYALTVLAQSVLAQSVLAQSVLAQLPGIPDNKCYTDFNIMLTFK